MNAISALEIKRRGISSLDEQIKSGPVHVIKNNRPQYVVMTESRYEEIMEELNEAWELRIKASLDEVKAGQVQRGTADALIRDIFPAD